MKKLFVLFVLLFTMCLFNTAIAQQLRIITMDQDDGLLAIPSRIILSHGDTLQFVSTNGDFTLYIEDAYTFLQIREADLKVRVNSSTSRESDKYVVREIDGEMELSYSIYCITANSWPDAPPRIIIVAQ